MIILIINEEIFGILSDAEKNDRDLISLSLLDAFKISNKVMNEN